MPLTLAIRGRGDSHELEYRDDGTANAILTPNNGGRAGIGVGAVAAYGIRSDASRDGEALTPSPDAEGRIRKRDPGFNVYDECSPTLDGGVPHSVGAFRWKMGAKAHGIGYEPDKTGSVETNAGGYAIASPGMSVRRLTPRECERLQGFPDDFTAVAYRGKPAADGPRYRALGNSMAVPVIGWILQRVRLVDEAAP
jgi:DNA (cytosine-5)-methyltransferase 1